MADLYASAPRRAEPTIAAWWPRLFQAAVAAGRDEAKEKGDIASQAINSAAGKLTNAVLVDLDAGGKEGAKPILALVDNLVTAASAEGGAGTLASAIIIDKLALVLSFDVGAVNDRVAAAVAGDGWQPRALRNVLVTRRVLSSTETRLLRRAVFDGAISPDLNDGAYEAALNVLQPALDVVRRGGEAEDWGLCPDGAARALREGSLALREGALEVMTDWVGQAQQSPEASWRTAVQPLMGECPAFCVRDCRSMLRGKDSVDHGEEDRRLDTGRAAEGLRSA